MPLRGIVRGVGTQPEQFGVVEVHAGVVGQIQRDLQSGAGVVGPARRGQQSRQDGVVERDQGDHPDRAPGVQDGGEGGDVRLQSVGVGIGVRMRIADGVVGQRDQRGHGRVLRRADHRPRIESVLFADCGQRGGDLRRAVQLAGLDPDQHLDLPDIRQAERALRESQLLTTAFGGRQFGLGAGQVAVDVARQRAMGVAGPPPNRWA